VSAPLDGFRRGAFGVAGSGDTSGFGGLVRVEPGGAVALHSTDRPYGGWFDEVTDALIDAVGEETYAAAVQRVLVDRGEITYFVVREHLLTLVRALRDDDALRFELMTYRRRIRLETAVTAEDPHVPSVTGVYPTADWHEREAWDMFGIVFDGHPGLTRILMPDDWEGHPQRKDHPLGGVPVEYHGATVPPPDERRSYR
jgi:NADH-quinone oxidoreductase subunit C